VLNAEHYPLPGEPGYTAPPAGAAAPAAATSAAAAAPAAAAKPSKPPAKAQGEKKAKPAKPAGGKKGAAAAGGADDVMDVTLLDFRVGLVTEAKLHPDSDKLFLETSEWAPFCVTHRPSLFNW
jgi:hypothetical protein